MLLCIARDSTDAVPKISDPVHPSPACELQAAETVESIRVKRFPWIKDISVVRGAANLTATPQDFVLLITPKFKRSRFRKSPPLETATDARRTFARLFSRFEGDLHLAWSNYQLIALLSGYHDIHKLGAAFSDYHGVLASLRQRFNWFDALQYHYVWQAQRSRRTEPCLGQWHTLDRKSLEVLAKNSSAIRKFKATRDSAIRNPIRKPRRARRLGKAERLLEGEAIAAFK